MWRLGFSLTVPVRELRKAFKLAAWQCTALVRLYQTAQGFAGFSAVNAKFDRHAHAQVLSDLLLSCTASLLSCIKQNDSVNSIFWCSARPNQAVFLGGPTPISTE